jgi:hypothetical protein
MRPKLTYANVTATLALIIAVGGASAFAATQLAKNSVGANQLKKNAVTTAKIKREAITAAKVKKGTLTGAQVNATTLGTVPTAQTAQTANSLSPPEAWRVVGAIGEPPFEHSWHNAPPLVGSPNRATVAFYKDQNGVVHLRGEAAAGNPKESIFQLPVGYRPAANTVLETVAPCGTCTNSFVDVLVFGNISKPVFGDGAVEVEAVVGYVSLDGITFRAES